MNPTTRSGAPRSRRRWFITAGAVAAGLSIAGAGAATAGNDATGPAGPTPAPAAEESTMPDGYTQEQYDAFWGSGYSAADVETLNALWGSDYTETKARAGQMILDGLTVPVAPTGPDEGTVEIDPDDPAVALLDAQYEAFWGAGYTGEDADALSAVWHSEIRETKARAGQMLLDGQTLPVTPSGTPAGS